MTLRYQKAMRNLFFTVVLLCRVVYSQETKNLPTEDRDSVPKSGDKIHVMVQQCYEKIDKLQQTVASHLNEMRVQHTNEIDEMKAIHKRELHQKSEGVSYIRWGRTTCNKPSTVIYKGYVGGAHYSNPGSGSNYLCLPEQPQWGNYVNGLDPWGARIYGTEYQSAKEPVFSTTNNGGRTLYNNDAPCAVCLASTRSSQIMIPARRECPYGWTMEYRGYLVAQAYHHHAKEYVCLDEAPEVVSGGSASTDEAVFYAVEAVCGSLHCPPYVYGWELTCVVCSK